MKVSKLIVVCSVLLVQFFAQKVSAQQISLGAKVGVNYSQVYTTELLGSIVPDFKFTPGITTGAVAEFGFSPNFALQPELLYSQRGFSWNIGTDVEVAGIPVPVGATATFRSNYIEMPLLAKGKFGNEKVQFYVAGGPSLGYATSANIITRPRLLFELDAISTPVNLSSIKYERFEVAAVGALGVQFNLRGGKLFFDARYVHGFTELYDFPVVNEKIRNQGMAFSAGWMFDLNGGGASTSKKSIPRRGSRTNRPLPNQ